MMDIFICENTLSRNSSSLLRPGDSVIELEQRPDARKFPTLSSRTGLQLVPRRCFALDLVNDVELIAEYERLHAAGAVWPAVSDHIRATGIESMEIWRTGDRLFMIAEVAEDYPRDVTAPAETNRWEELMWRFQRPLPHAVEGEKWVPMRRIYALDEQ